MALSPGSRLGPYEVLAPIGAGGMGEVYRARDTRLDRTVAIKVLPGGLAADPELKVRFEREARAISALAHPNICTLHDVGEQDGQTFLVMEHLVGQALDERLKKGPLPLEQALEVAAQIADALAAAHKEGIVHRDLKPGNVMLTKTGARLLDFGLARLTAHGEQPAVDNLTSAPTKETPLTGQGTVLGTLPYMAPEQVEGRPADERADLWALGAILYEMVSGRRPFEASTATSLVGAILEREPAPLGERQPLTPRSLERLVLRCLAKDPEERWGTANDLAARLREIAESDPEVEARLQAKSARRLLIPTVAGAVLLALVAGVMVVRLSLRSGESVRAAPVVRSQIDLPSETSLRGFIRTELALSPDGTLLVWSGSPPDRPEESALYLRQLESDETKRLPGTEEARQPIFSPDGRFIAFYSQGKLRKVAVDGGLAVDLAEMRRLPMGAAWAPDGRIYLGASEAGLRWVSADGGAPQEITTFDRRREVGHRLPSVLPDGRTVLMTTMPIAFGVGTRTEAVSLESGERKVLIEDAADARYLPTGRLVFVRQGVLMAVPFDLARLEVMATPVPVVSGLSQALNRGGSGANSGAAQFAVADSGLLVYGAGGIGDLPSNELILMDESCRTELLPGFDKPLVFQGRFSPDGRRYAWVEDSRGLWLFDVERETHRPLQQEGHAGGPLWSPDGRRLALHWTKAGPPNLWSLPVEGGAEWERLTESDVPDLASSWSPDGRFLAFVRIGASADILLYRFEDRQVVPFLATEDFEGYAEFSPDGRWMAYVSDESGRPEVYVTSFPDREQVLAVSGQGGVAPAWSRDGTKLFYRSLDRGPLMSVRVSPGESLSLGRPRKLCDAPFEAAHPWRGYDLHPDGRRFQFQRRVEQATPPAPITRLNLVHNWFAELERLSPTGR